MSRRTNLLLALALSLSVAPACDEAIEGDFGDASDIAFRPGWGSGGLQLNTNALGDHPLHELHTKGELHEDTVLKAVFVKTYDKGEAKYEKLDEVWSKQGELFGRIDKRNFRGAQFIDSKWEVETHGGGLVNRVMFIQNYRYDHNDSLHKYVLGYPTDPAYGKHFYTKENFQIKGTKLFAACAVDAEGGMEAVVAENLHVDMKSADVKMVDNIINFGCLSAAIGKAPLWGYRSFDLDDKRFQAALRMVRADYLGDGDSWTKSGTPIDLEDNLGINSFFDPTLKLEAIWTPDGAACIKRPRRAEFSTADVVAEGVPECKEDWDLTSFADAVMWTRTP